MCERQQLPLTDNALQGRTTLYLYEVNGLFVASQVLKAVADGGSTLAALNTIKTYASK